MNTTAQCLMTAQEFEQLVDSDMHQELVRGEVMETVPPTPRHGEIAGKIHALIWLWLRDGIGGYVGVEGAYVLSRNPDTVRAPGVSYVRAENVPEDGAPDSFWPIAPDLAVEVVSKNESANDVQEKVQDFLAAGTPLVWVVFPRRREVVAHTADGLARRYGEEDVLEYPDVLPGFACRVGELFE